MGDVDPVARALADRVIDRVMVHLCALLPAAAPDEAALPGGMLAAPPPAPAGGGALAGVAGDAPGPGRSHAALRDLDERAGAVVSAALSAGLDARRRAEGLREQTRAEVGAVLPMTGSSAGMRLLVSLLDERVAAVGGEVDAARRASASAAQQLRELVAGYGRRSV